MDKYLEPIREKIKTNKRKIIKRASIGVAIIAGLGIAAFTTVYSIAKSNINYTVEEAKAIVLQSVPGEIVRVNKRSSWEGLTKLIQAPGSNVLISLNSNAVDRNICSIKTTPPFTLRYKI